MFISISRVDSGQLGRQVVASIFCTSGMHSPFVNRVSDGTGWPGVSILRLGEMESLICNFYLSVAARKIV